MKKKLIGWWQKYKSWKGYEKYIVGGAIIALAILALIRVGYQIDAAGFNGSHTVTTATSYSGTSPVTVTRTEVEVPAKSFWDWMQLLIIPAVLAIGGYFFNLTVSRNEQKSTELRDQTEREIASDNQCEVALQAYIDKMSELLLHEHLRGSSPENEVRKIARVRTLTLLPRLDANRKRNVLQFLYESGLINVNEHMIDLDGANLSEAFLRAVNLSGANLKGANLERAFLIGARLNGARLSKANLKGAFLVGADLSGADLYEADLSEVDLSGANLEGANLKGANLGSTNLSKTMYREALSMALIKSILSSLNLIIGTLTENSLTSLKVEKVGGNLTLVLRKGANLHDADLSGAFLDGADFSGGDLSEARLCSAVLSSAKLRDAKLNGTDLSEAFLVYADLSSANLSGANLKDAILEGANFKDSNITQEQLASAKSIKDIIR